MRILHTVESYYPSVGGMPEVVKQISEELALSGHSVTVATSFSPQRSKLRVNKVNIKQFHLGGNLVNGIQGTIDEQNRYVKYVTESRFDIVANFAAQQWATDLVLPLLSRIKAKKIFIPTGFSGLYIKEYKQYFEQMGSWMKQYDMNVFSSATYQDFVFSKLNKIKKLCIIPNGASKKEFEPQRINELRRKLQIPINHFLIILVGSHTGLKGHFEAMEIFKKSRLTNSTLLIIGNKLKEGCYGSCRAAMIKSKFRPDFMLFNKKIKVMELTRPDTVQAFFEADLLLFPSNIECSPIILFESMASKTPFLVSDVGNSKEIVSWSGGGLLLHSDKDNRGFSHTSINKSAQMLDYLWKDKSTRKELAILGYTSWKKKFTWEYIATQYESLYKSLLKT